MCRTTSRCACRRHAKSAIQPVRNSPPAIIVNLEYDPTAAFRNQVVHFDFRKLDVFSFGEEQNA